MFRTTASARTMPPGTSKTSVRSVPTRSVLDPQRNIPPMLNVLTRETCCWPLPYQVTDMPRGKEIRRWRRVPQKVSAVIKQGKSTRWIGGEPIEQKFLFASTLEKPLGSPASPLYGTLGKPGRDCIQIALPFSTPANHFPTNPLECPGVSLDPLYDGRRDPSDCQTYQRRAFRARVSMRIGLDHPRLDSIESIF